MPLTRSARKSLQIGQHGMIRWYKNSRLYGCSVKDTWMNSPKKLPQQVVELRWDGSKKSVFCLADQVDEFDVNQIGWQHFQSEQFDYFLKMQFDQARKAVVQFRAQRRQEIRQMRRQKGRSLSKSASPSPSNTSSLTSFRLRPRSK